MNTPAFDGLKPVANLNATLTVPGSKSLTNRALLAAALAEGTSRLDGILSADDTEHMVTALTALGVAIDRPGEGQVMVEGAGGRFPVSQAILHVGNAGTAMRFLLAALCVPSGKYILSGDERMLERPIGDLVDALRALGADLEYPGREGHPPVLTRGGLLGGTVRVDVSRSSQYLSGLLLAAPLAPSPTRIEVDGELVSRPYVDMTLSVMEAFGGEVAEEREGCFLVSPGGYRATDYTVECDASSASYFLAAAALAGGRVEVEGVGSASVQGDARFAEVLERMGCEVRREPHSTTVLSTGELRGIDIDMNDMPDVALTLAAVAACAKGTTTVRNVANLRIKESDRIDAICTELGRAGIEATPRPDGFEIVGGTPGPAAIETYDDHRIAMTFSLLGIRTPGIKILDPGCVAKTFPDYFDRLRTVFATGEPRDVPEVES